MCTTRRSGDSISPLVVRGLGHNHLPVPWLPFQSYPTLPTGHCQSWQCMGSDEPYVLHPCRGASTLPLCCLAAPCVGAMTSSQCLCPCSAPWLRVTSHTEEAPWGDLATRCHNRSQDMTLLEQNRLRSALHTGRTPQPQTSGEALCWDRGSINSMLGMMRPFCI